MSNATQTRSGYSRTEFLSDAVVHVTGLTLVLMALPVLIVITGLFRGDLHSMFGVGVYSAALLAMLSFSALCNMGAGTARAWLYRRLDHAAIYVKIAGTYTPFTLLTGQGMALTLGLWGAALAGVVLKLISPEKLRWLALALYLGMGWAGVVAGQALLAALPMPVLVLMMLGGGLYTLGVVFYLWTTLPYHNTIWHVFVLVASLVFYAAVMVQVLLG
ncbi:MAG: hemolysin III family protein [Pararhodobacter sp.]|nr:hemolysin III family protein [Pararhodobacter sp.]